MIDQWHSLRHCLKQTIDDSRINQIMFEQNWVQNVRVFNDVVFGFDSSNSFFWFDSCDEENTAIKNQIVMLINSWSICDLCVSHLCVYEASKQIYLWMRRFSIELSSSVSYLCIIIRWCHHVTHLLSFEKGGQCS